MSPINFNRYLEIPILVKYQDFFPKEMSKGGPGITTVSNRVRKDREFGRGCTTPPAKGTP